MPLLTEAADAAADAVTAVAVQVSLHTGDPGATGANEVSGGGYARLSVIWDPAFDGIAAANNLPLAFTGLPGQTVSHVGMWTTGGAVWLGGEPAQLREGALEFNEVGQLVLDAVTVEFAIAAPTFELGLTKPDATNTGLLSPTTTTSTGSTITFSVDGQVIENIRFERRVSVTGKNITFRNCDFAGGSTSDQNLLQCSNSNVENLLVEHCRFLPVKGGVHLSRPSNAAVFGHDFTLRRCDISGVDDGVSLVNSSAPAVGTIEGCYIHDLSHYCPHPSTVDGDSHPDGVQVHHSVGSLTIVGCTIRAFANPAYIHDYAPPVFDGIGTQNDGQGKQIAGYQYFYETSRNGGPGLWATAGIMFSPAGPTISNVTISKNWIDGGAIMVNIAAGHTYSNCVVSGNRFGRDSRGGKAYGLLPGWTEAGNIIEATGALYASNQAIP